MYPKMRKVSNSQSKHLIVFDTLKMAEN